MPDEDDVILRADTVMAVQRSDGAVERESVVRVPVYGWRTPQQLAQLVSYVYDRWSRA